MQSKPLAGARILIVEDEVLVAMDIEMALDNAGCAIVGPASTVHEAVGFIGHELLDIAVLDLNLNGEKSFAIADALTAAGVPFVWVTGHSADVIPPRHRRQPLVTKPFLQSALIAALARVLRERPCSAADAAS